ncbi:Secreted protein OS=Streptomyces microflavus OX=1919 GN=HUT09_18740 PE=4 SV=1 [Streptomyces microflavus]
MTVEADGPKPFSASTVAGLVKEQLDHITSPGESI